MTCVGRFVTKLLPDLLESYHHLQFRGSGQ
jgi:hypothetical protein